MIRRSDKVAAAAVLVGLFLAMWGASALGTWLTGVAG